MTERNESSQPPDAPPTPLVERPGLVTLDLAQAHSVQAQAVPGQSTEELQSRRDPQRPVQYVWPKNVVRSYLQMHTIFFVMCFAIILMSFLMRSEGPTQVFLPGTQVPLPGTCVSRQITGYDCPGCGLTRAFISISHGQFSRAWDFNAASFVLYPFLLVQIVWHPIQIYLLWTRRRAIEIPYIVLLPVGVVTLMALHWVWRIGQQWNVM